MPITAASLQASDESYFLRFDRLPAGDAALFEGLSLGSEVLFEVADSPAIGLAYDDNRLAESG